MPLYYFLVWAYLIYLFFSFSMITIFTFSFSTITCSDFLIIFTYYAIFHSHYCSLVIIFHIIYFTSLVHLLLCDPSLSFSKTFLSLFSNITFFSDLYNSLIISMIYQSRQSCHDPFTFFTFILHHDVFYSSHRLPLFFWNFVIFTFHYSIHSSPSLFILNATFTGLHSIF